MIFVFLPQDLRTLLFKVLTSEDSQLRHRVDGAMSEMGGMAAKLTDALKERDALKKEVRLKIFSWGCGFRMKATFISILKVAVKFILFSSSGNDNVYSN